MKLIFNKNDFRDIQNDLNEDYKLMNNIDFENENCFIEGNFNGTIDGGFFIVENIKNIGESAIFENYNGTMENIWFRNIRIETVSQKVGGVIKYSNPSSIYKKIRLDNVIIETQSADSVGGFISYGGASLFEEIRLNNIRINIETNIRKNVKVIGGLIGDASEGIGSVLKTSSLLFGGATRGGVVSHLIGHLERSSTIEDIAISTYETVFSIDDNDEFLEGDTSIGGVIGSYKNQGGALTIKRVVMFIQGYISDRGHFGTIIGNSYNSPSSNINISKIISFIRAGGSNIGGARFGQIVGGYTRPTTITEAYYGHTLATGIYWQDRTNAAVASTTRDLVLVNTLGFDTDNVWVNELVAGSSIVDLRDFFKPSQPEGVSNLFIQKSGNVLRAQRLFLFKGGVWEEAKSIIVQK